MGEFAILLSCGIPLIFLVAVCMVEYRLSRIQRHMAELVEIHKQYQNRRA